MSNPVSTPEPRDDAYEVVEQPDEVSARIRFTGPFEGRRVAWDATVATLGAWARRYPARRALRPFIHVGADGPRGVALSVGLNVPAIDTPVLRKTVIMIRNYRRLRRGRHEFGEAVEFAPPRVVVEKIVSGGQTGVDRAALDAAAALGIAGGGWCPKDRRAEDGAIPPRYPLTETPSRDYRERTERNVLDSDGTLILARGRLGGGTALTQRLAQRHGKPVRVLDLEARADIRAARDWLEQHRIRILNIAGPRASTHPGIHAQARRFLIRLLAPLRAR